MQQRRLVYALARVWRVVDTQTPQIVGTALLVSARHLLSCAHVVNAALGRPEDAAERPDGLRSDNLVQLDFPASAPGHRYTARVVVWQPRRPQAGGRYDIAGLELDATLPEEAVPAPLVLETPAGQPCRIFGFPAGRPGGNYADGTLGDVLANGWMMLRGGSEAREFVRPGYSGGPVYTAQGVVGLISEGEQGARVREAVMIPARTLLAAWPELYRLGYSCPYRGLSSFTEGHAGVFFGREQETAALRAIVARPASVTLLAGASGSGKSSLIAAGLLPSLRERGWHVLYLRPGSDPFRALARALLSLWKPELTGVSRLAEEAELGRHLGRGTLSLAEIIAELPTDAKAPGRLLLALDQAEELLTLGNGAGNGSREVLGEGDAARFLTGLLSALTHPETSAETAGRLSLLLGVRTDFLDRLSTLVPLPDPQLLYLGAVGDLKAVIERPLEGSLSRLEPGLSERLVQDVSAEANPLPLLEFTLSALWHAQVQGTLTHAAYDAMGGVSQAVAGHAQATFASLSAAEQRQTERLFVQLMQPTEDGAVTRRVASLAELGEGAEPLLKKLADRHLIVTGRDPARPDSAEVVHEALFEHWPLLKAWAEAHRQFRRWQEGLRTAQRDWLEAGRHPDYLLQGARLAVAEDYLGSDAAQLSAAERHFIELGLGREAQRAQEKTAALQQQVRQRQRLNYALGSFLLLALTLSGLAGWQGWRAQTQARVAQGLNTRLLGANDTLQRTSQQVQDNARRALAHKLSAQGLLATQQPSPLNGDPRLGALLASEAVTLDDNAQSRGNLLRVLQSELVLHSDGEQLSALSSDGRTLALTDSGALSLWDTARKVQTLELAPSGTLYLNSLSFGPEGRTLAATGLDGRLRLWRVKDGLELPAPALSPGYPATASFSAGGALLVATLDGQLQVWTRSARAESGWQRTASLSRRAPATTAPPRGLPSRRPSTLAPRDEHLVWLRGAALSPDGHTLALLDDAGAVQLFRMPSATPLGRFTLPNDARSLAFAPGGAALAVGDREGRVTLLDLRTGAQTPLFTLGSLVTQLAFSPEGRVLAAAEASGAVTLWPLDAAQPLATSLPVTSERVHQLAFAGTRLLVRAQEGTRTALYEVATSSASPALVRNLRVTWQQGAAAALWDVTGSEALSTPLLEAADTFPQQLSFSPDGRRLSLRSDSRAVYLFDARSRRLLAGPLPGQDDIESVAFSLDSQTLATGTREGDIALRDARTGRVRRRLPQRYGRALALAFHPGGRALALGTEGGVKVIDLATGNARTPEWDIPAPQRQELVGSINYTPDGRKLLAAYGTFVYVWDARTLALVAPLAGMAGERMVRQLHVSPEGRWLLAAYNDGWTAGVWELDTLESTQTLTDVSGAAFGDGLLATGSGAGEVTLWNAATLEPLSDPVAVHRGEVRALAFAPSATRLVSSATDNSVHFWQTGLPSWRAAACGRAERNLSAAEWRAFLGDLPYHKTCTDYPVDPSALELLLAQTAAAQQRNEPQHAAALLGRARSYAFEAPALTAALCTYPGGEQLGCAEAATE